MQNLRAKKPIIKSLGKNRLYINVHGKSSLFYKVIRLALDSDSFGVTQHRFKLILINSQKSLPIQIYTLIHERIHELIAKIFRFNKINEKLDGFLDFVDYLASDFKAFNHYRLKANRSFGYMANFIMNRYKYSLDKAINDKKQLKLSDFPEFKPICDSYEKSVKNYRDLRKRLESGSIELKQTVLAPIPEKSLKKEVV